MTIPFRKGVSTESLAEEYLAGKTTVELGKKYEMSPAAVNGRLSRFGVEIRAAKRRTRYDADDVFVQRVRDSYKAGQTSNDIAIALGVGRMTVIRTLNKAGITKRRNGTRARTIKLPTDLMKIGYLAGLFDGEGNIQFKKKTRSGRESTGCKVAIYGTVPATMGWLKLNVGGSVRRDYKRQERHGWLPCGVWEIYRAQDVLVFLRLVEPLLTAKKKQAIKAIKFLADKCHQDSPPAIIQSS